MHAFRRTAARCWRPAGDRAGYLDQAIGHKKRKELRRQRKRLDECGRVTSSSTGEPAAVPSALADFLALEAGGWKGRAGTAARGDADVAAFMTSAVTALAGEGKARIARLRVGDASDRRDRDASQRRDRVVLEDRL